MLFFIAATCYLRSNGIRLQYLQFLRVEYFAYTLENIKGVKAYVMTSHEEVSIEFKNSVTIGFTNSG